MNMNLIFLLILLGINVLMALMGRIFANPHKNIILETTLPKDKLNEPQVLQVRRAYKKRLLWIAGLFSLVDVLVLFVARHSIIRYDSIALIFFMVSLFALIGINYYTQIIFIRKMTHVKMTNGWLVPTKPLLVDTKLIQNKNRKLLSFFWYLPSFAITLAGIVYTLVALKQSMGTLVIGVVSLLMIGLFVFLHYRVSRLPVKPLTDQEDINQQVNDAMRHYWSLMMILSALVFSPLSFLPALSIAMSYELSMILTFSYFALMMMYIGVVFYLLFKLRRTQDQLILHASDYRYGDEDQYWRYGIYINPDDPRVIVPDRLGMNMSTNLGRPAGRISMILLTVAVVIIACITLLVSDFSSDPFRMSITGDTVDLSAPFSKTREIPLDDITAVQLVDHLPKGGIRVFGSATDHYLTGEFRFADDSAYLLVYRDESPVIEIKTADYTYYFTTKDSESTMKQYQQLLEKVDLVS